MLWRALLFIPHSFAWEVIFDLGFYLAHRLVHANRFLYIFAHKPHHKYQYPNVLAGLSVLALRYACLGYRDLAFCVRKPTSACAVECACVVIAAFPGDALYSSTANLQRVTCLRY